MPDVDPYKMPTDQQQFENSGNMQSQQEPTADPYKMPSNMQGQITEKSNEPIYKPAVDPNKDTDGTSKMGTGDWWGDKLTILNHGFEQYALGGLQLLNAANRNTLGYLPGIGDEITKNSYALDDTLSQIHKDKDSEFNTAMKRTPSPYLNVASNIAGGLAFSAPAVMATTTAGTTGLLGTAAQGLAQGAATGALDYSNTLGERAIKMGLGGASGAAIGGLVGGLSSHFVGQLVKPKTTALDDLVSSVKTDAGGNLDNAISSVQAVKNAGVQNRTPGEALGGMVTRNQESALNAADDMKPKIVDAYNTSQQGGIDKLKSTISNLSNDDTVALQKQSFKNMESQYVNRAGKLSNADDVASQVEEVTSPHGLKMWRTKDAGFYAKEDALDHAKIDSVGDIPEVVANNRVLKRAYDEVGNSDAKELSDLPNSSMAKLWATKKNLDNKLYLATPDKMGNVKRVLTDDKKLAISGALKELYPILQQSPDYPAAMATTQKIKIKDQYTDLFKDVKTDAGTSQKSYVDNVYNVFFSKEGQKESFIKNIEAAGGDPKNAQNVISLMDSLRKSPLKNILKDAKNVNGVEVPSSILDFARKVLDKTLLKRYNKAMLNIMLSGDKWADDVLKVLQKEKGASQFKSFFSLLGKAETGGQIGAEIKSRAKQLIQPTAVSAAAAAGNTIATPNRQTYGIE